MINPIFMYLFWTKSNWVFSPLSNIYMSKLVFVVIDFHQRFFCFSLAPFLFFWLIDLSTRIHNNDGLRWFLLHKSISLLILQLTSKQNKLNAMTLFIDQPPFNVFLNFNHLVLHLMHQNYELQKKKKMFS